MIEELAVSRTEYGDIGDSFYESMVASFGVGGGVTALIVYVIFAIGAWKTFSKADIPGILAIIPIVNVVFTLRVARMSMWLAFLYLIPIVNLVLAIIVAIRVGRNFGHGGAFSFFLLWLLAPIGYLILGFSSDRFQPDVP